MKRFSSAAVAAAAACSLACCAASADTIRIAYLDPLSGPFAAVGINSMQSLQYAAELASREKWAGDHSFEVVGFDNKNSPQESVTLLKSVIDRGFHFIASGGSSGATMAVVDAVNKHNARNPGKALLVLNYASVDPELTNARCSFWHFRYDAHIGMKTEAMTNFIAEDPSIKKVYLIGQNYVSGIQFNQFTHDLLRRKRPDIAIVGNDLHPIGQVKDFAPYIAKIKQSGADSVITGNWGLDLVLLIRAANEAGLKVNFYTFYAALKGAPEAIGAAGEDRVKYGTTWHPNNETFSGAEIVEGFKKKFEQDYYMGTTYTLVASLAQAIRQAGSVDPTKIAFALEGMSLDALNGRVTMRREDHQLQQPFYITTWTRADGRQVRYAQGGTGFGWKTDRKIEADAATQTSTCVMQRPDPP